MQQSNLGFSSTDIRILDAYREMNDDANNVQEGSRMVVLTGTITIKS